MKEIIELRKSREKHFLNEDGTITLNVYDEAVHYKKGNEYVEIDNHLEEKNNKIENKENDFKVSFNKDTFLINISKEDYFINMRLRKDKKLDKVSFKENQIIYYEVMPGIDFKYDLVGKTAKETIVIKTPIANLEKIDFLLETNLNLKLNDNKVLALDEFGNTIYEFNAPYMIDDKQEFGRCHYELEREDDIYILNMYMDSKWLSNASYPVLIDPTITGESGGVYDTYIYPGDTGVNRNSHEYLKVGVDSNNVKYRILTKFDLPKIGTGSQVINATAIFHSYKNDYYPSGQHLTAPNKIATIHEVTSNWNENTATWETMNNKCYARIESYLEMRRGIISYDGGTTGTVTLSANEFDVTSLVKKWYSGTPNYGFLIKWLDEVKDTKCKEYYLYSKDNKAVSSGVIKSDPKPVLVIKYRNQNGLLDYMSYNNIGFSNGNSNINNYNGNIVNNFLVNKTAGNNALSLNAIYNTNDAVLNNNFNLALGWKFNYDEQLTIKSINTNNDYIEYLTGNAARHYFYKDDDGVFKSEDGLGLSIKLENNEYVMTDKNNNKYHFTMKNNIYYLYKVVGIDKHTLSIKRDTNNRVVEVSNDHNQKISISYGNNKIDVVSENETSSLILTEGKLSEIVTDLGTTRFVYNSNNIISEIIDIMGKRIKYEYYSAIPYRVRKVTEYGLNNAIGKSQTFNYEFNATTIVDNLNKEIRYTFNNIGNTIGTVLLGDDNALKNSYGFSAGYVSELNTSLTNKTLSNSLPLKYGENLIVNSSFETTAINGFNSLRVKGNARTGEYAAKIDGDAYVEVNNMLKVNKCYIWSAYFKNNSKINLEINATSAYDTTLINNLTIMPNDEYTRYEIPIIINDETTTILSFEFRVDDGSVAYMDDMQLEKGEVASPYNLVENSNFIDGLNGYSIDAVNIDTQTKINNSCEITGIEEKILKINSNPKQEITVSKSINLKGKKGDVYTLSFWYINEGVLDTDLEYIGNMATISFYNPNDEMGMGTYNVTLNYHAKSWQYFTETFIAEDDYESIDLTIFSLQEANCLCITDISLVKDLGSYFYNYDEEGNLITTYDITNNKSEFKYDKNNQLMGMFDPKGNNYKYEYDNNITDRLLKGISPTGISNEIEYDNFGNPVKTIINNVNANKTNNIFYIRVKGTKKYLTPDIANKTLLIKEFVCNKYAFKLTTNNNDTTIAIASLDNYVLCSPNNTLSINKYLEPLVLNIEKKPNGSVCFKAKVSGLYFKVQDDKVILSKYIEGDNSFEFYLEDIDSEEFIEAMAEYTSDGKYVSKTIDSLGNATIYVIDELTGLTKSITNAKEQKTIYEYDDKKKLKSIINNNKKINYEYDNNLLSSIKSGSKNYTFSYDDFLNQKEVKINNNLLSSYEYEVNNGNLLTKTYGNGKNLKYEYDSFNRLKKFIKGEEIYEYSYNNLGLLSKIMSNRETIYKYDFANRLSEIIQDNIFRLQYRYDNNNNVSKKIDILDSIKHVNDYFFNEDDAVIKVTVDNDTVNYNYDYLGRLKNKDINNKLKTEYSYKHNGNKASLIVDSININGDIYKYQYDALYNITSTTLNDKVINEYTYDARNQLVEDINYELNQKYMINYDNEGNILSKDIYEITSGKLLKSDKYEYNNSSWEDQLTKYNNESITYDTIGNPITIGSKNLTWDNGRELTSIDGLIKYDYNEDGIRVRKTVGENIINYYLSGSKIIYETRGNKTLYYIRDEVGDPIGLIYEGRKYYYKKNIQRDVIGIYDSNYNLTVKYEYDSYGKVISIKNNSGIEITDTNHIGNINPIRYRSYYYDTESGYYYLNSRYYNPEWGRFINADGIIGTSNNVNTYNLYSYVENNFINKYDSSGLFSIPNLLMSFTNGISVAAGMFLYSLTDFVISKKYDNNSKLANTLKKSNVMSQEISKNTGELDKSLSNSKTFTGSVELYDNSTLADKDLAYSVGKADYKMTISKKYSTSKIGFVKKMKLFIK